MKKLLFISIIVLFGCGDSNKLSESKAENIVKRLNQGRCFFGIKEYKKFIPALNPQVFI